MNLEYRIEIRLSTGWMNYCVPDTDEEAAKENFEIVKKRFPFHEMRLVEYTPRIVELRSAEKS